MLTDQCSHWLCAGLLAALTAMHPWAASGAAFGCCFFLASPSSTTGWQRLKLCLFSWGAGYAAGLFFYGEGPPYSNKAMLVSAAVAALVAVTFTGFYHVIDRNGPLPEWLSSILNLIPWTKNRGDDNGT